MLLYHVPSIRRLTDPSQKLPCRIFLLRYSFKTILTTGKTHCNTPSRIHLNHTWRTRQLKYTWCTRQLKYTGRHMVTKIHAAEIFLNNPIHRWCISLALFFTGNVITGSGFAGNSCRNVDIIPFFMMKRCMFKKSTCHMAQSTHSQNATFHHKNAITSSFLHQFGRLKA